MPDLHNLDIQGLLDLRDQVDRHLLDHQRALERQLSRFGGAAPRGRTATGQAGKSKLFGRKVAPKYRGPGGELWSGRGARPRWMQALLREGHTIEEFAIGARRTARKRSANQVSRRKRK